MKRQSAILLRKPSIKWAAFLGVVAQMLQDGDRAEIVAARHPPIIVDGVSSYP
jgi:hypothetical protein